jgi:hypothetical protein
VNTIVRVASSAAVDKAVREAGMSLVRIPHAAADNLGMNLFFDEIERRFGPLTIIPCNYFERVRRHAH